MNSQLQIDKECYVCRTTRNLHRHHIFAGNANRQLSERFGYWVYLCAYHHNASLWGVHFNKDLDLALKRTAQRVWEKTCSREEFIRTFGKSYL